MQTKDLVVSERDNNNYLFIKLENGLQALLIQDIPDLKEQDDEKECQSDEEEPEDLKEDQEEDDEEEEEEGSRLAAVALSVSAGCFHEQRECNGIAHFLEHMCFMGSETYPNQNEFDNLLNKYGGYSNAFTDVMNTNYQFSVSAKHLNKMLDIFAHFFIDPLLKPDAVNREIEAIQNQFETSLTSQAHRFHQIFMYFCHTPEVRGRFLMGSADSILGPKSSPQAKAEERQGFKDGMQHLRHYFNKNYDPRAMRLVVSSSAPLEEMKKQVIKSFSAIPHRVVPQFEWKSEVPFITTESAKQMVLFESTKTDTVLYLIWGFPCTGVEYRSKSTGYLANLIGHQAKGSLLYLLKMQQYASTLSAYYEQSVNVVSHLFYIQIKLTDRGLENLNSVVSLIFSYLVWLQQLPSLPHHLFEEVKQMKDIKFRYLEKEDTFDHVTDIAQKWTFLEDSDRHLLLRQKQECYSGIDEAEIKNYLNQMTLQSTKFYLSVPHLFQKGVNILERDPERKTNTHPFYNIKVVQASRDSILIKPIELNPTKVQELGADLPTPNPYIPSDFQSVNEEYDKLEPGKKGQLDLTPELLFENETLKLYYSLDKTFKMPSSVYSFVVTLDEPRQSPRDNAFFGEFMNYLEESFNIAHAYYGYLAKADYEISMINERGIYFRVEGYMHNLDKFVFDFFQTFRKIVLDGDIDLNLLKVEKEQALKKKKNSLMSGTYLSNSIRANLHKNQAHWEELLNSQIEHSSEQEFIHYVKHKLSKCTMSVTAFYYGCLSEQKVKTQIQQVLSPLKSFQPIEKSRLNELKQEMAGLVPLSPSAIHPLRLINRNPESQLSSCIVSFSIPLNFEQNELASRLTVNLLNHLMSQRCFNELRTKQALGYAVYSSHWRTRKVLGVEIVVQSAKHDPDYLQSRIKDFLLQFVKDMEQKQEEMKEDMQGLAEQLETPYNKVSELAQALWNQILHDTFLFNSKREMLKSLNSIDYSKFTEQAKQILLKKEGGLNAQVIKVYERKKIQPQDELEKTPIHEQLTEIKAKYVVKL